MSRPEETWYTARNPHAYCKPDPDTGRIDCRHKKPIPAADVPAYADHIRALLRRQKDPA